MPTPEANGALLKTQLIVSEMELESCSLLTLIITSHQLLLLTKCALGNSAVQVRAQCEKRAIKVVGNARARPRPRRPRPSSAGAAGGRGVGRKLNFNWPNHKHELFISAIKPTYINSSGRADADGRTTDSDRGRDPTSLSSSHPVAQLPYIK